MVEQNKRCQRWQSFLAWPSHQPFSLHTKETNHGVAVTSDLRYKHALRSGQSECLFCATCISHNHRYNNHGFIVLRKAILHAYLKSIVLMLSLELALVLRVTTSKDVKSARDGIWPTTSADSAQFPLVVVAVLVRSILSMYLSNKKLLTPSFMSKFAMLRHPVSIY